jgi:predicted ArsR family transcriptional regulator
VSTSASPPSPWDIAHVLAEPTRRQIFDAVRQAGTALTRVEVSALTGNNRRLTTFHLDRLTDAGLLVTDFARPADRPGGPGAGRPAKRYSAADVQLDISVPPRHYEFAARLLAQAITTAPTDAITGSFTLARAEGRRVGELRRPAGRTGVSRHRAAVLAALSDLGYEPTHETPTAVRLRNCPFRSAADVAPDLVCGMNCELVGGLVEGMGHDRSAVALDPAPPNCCLTVTLPA